jgi:hypothetical protein
LPASAVASQQQQQQHQQQSVLQQSVKNMSNPSNMPSTLYQSMHYPETKRQRMDAPIYDTNMLACLHCGLMFDTDVHREQHQEKCSEPEGNDESVWTEYYN